MMKEATSIRSLLKGLTQLKSVEEVRRENNCYALTDAGQLKAISLSKEHKNAIKLSRLLLDEDAAALRYINVLGIETLSEIIFMNALPELVYADFSRCALTEITLPPGFLKLEQLYLHNNQLQQITFQDACPEMILLDLAKNQLTEFSLPAGFTELAYLYMPDNQLKNMQLPADAGKLNILHLRNNKLDYFPENLIFDTKLESLYMTGNTPKNIPAVFLGGKDSHSLENCLEETRLWFEELRKGKTKNNKTVKLMLTGNSNTGKTSIVCALKSKNGKCEHQHTTTHGIQIDSIKGGKVDFNVWDFGGQEIYHGTHRLFMIAKSLQLIVFDPESEEYACKNKLVLDRASNELVQNKIIKSWLETAKELCEESKFLIVQNKFDKMPDLDLAVNQYASENKAKFLQTSALTGNRIDEIMFYLQKYASELPDYDMPMPASWLKVREYLIKNLEQKKPRKTIKEADFLKLCTSKKYIVGSKYVPLLQKYLLHSGYIYSHRHLGNTIILDQRWALEVIYKLLDRNSGYYKEFKEESKGKIKVSRLFESFGENYTPEEKWIFLDFMKSCRLCFQLNNNPQWKEPSEEDKYVFPRFLPEEVPPEVVYNWRRACDVKTYRFKMDWLNYYVIQSFIVALGRKTKANHIWRNGISVYTEEGLLFRVELNQKNSSIILMIEAQAEEKWLIPIMNDLNTDGLAGKWEFEKRKGAYSGFDRNSFIEKISKKSVISDDLQTLKSGKMDKQASDRLPDYPQYGFKVLFLAAYTDKYLPTFARLEHSCIAESIRGEIHPVFGVNIAIVDASIKEFNKRIIHFAGHGDDENGNKVFLLHNYDYENDHPIKKEQLGAYFMRLKKKKDPCLKFELVFFNACHTDEIAQEVSKCGIYSIGYQGDIGSPAVIAVSSKFYDTLNKNNWNITSTILKAFEDAVDIGVTHDSDIANKLKVYHNGLQINTNYDK